MDRLKIWLVEHPEHTTAELLEELRAIQTFASLRPADRIIIYLGTVGTDGLVTKGEVAANKEVLCALAPSAIQQRHLVAAFEWFCGRKYPQLMKFFPVVRRRAYLLFSCPSPSPFPSPLNGLRHRSCHWGWPAWRCVDASVPAHIQAPQPPAQVLKQLFDEEIVEEDVFFEWATGKQYLRRRALVRAFTF